MKIARYAIGGIFIGMFVFGYALSQQAGDYRSAATGDWSAASTWETFDGVNWVPAGSPPAGSETITVDDQDTVRVDVAAAITGAGYVMATNTGVIQTTSGSLTFGNGATYEHARDGGSVPLATWETGSTALFTGITGTAPDNRGQDYYNLTFNTPGLTSNRDMSLNDHTIGGDITVVSTGSARWQMVGGSSGTVTIMGDVIVQDGQFATQGTGSATDVIVDHYGNINVTGGNFSISRGSQGSGAGTTTWNLHQGNFSMSNATTQNSNLTPGNAKFVFAAADTQQITFSNVTYGGGDIHFKVADSTTMQITQDMEFNGLVINEGAIDAVGMPTFIDGSVYEHARDGGSVPVSIWGTGSTALFTGITGTAPDNRGQDYHNLTFNTPGLTSNRDMSLNDHTIGGNITVINTGTARWQMVGGASGTVNIVGDVIVQDGQFATQGTGSATDVIVNHFGNINVTGGNFSVSRGSQGSGAGTTTWNLYLGNFSMSNATTQNSNPTPGNAKFVFANAGGMQNLTLSNVTYAGGGLPIQVDSAATVNMDTSAIGGNGIFTLSDMATLATAHVNGLDGALQTTGAITLSQQSNFIFNGTMPQVPGALLPDTLGILTIANPVGVSFNDTLSAGELRVSAGAIMNVDTLGSVTSDSGAIAGMVINRGVLQAPGALAFEDGSVYEHARNEGSIPNGIWNEGSTLLLTGLVSAAPGNRNQNYYNVTFNTPNMLSNLDMGLNDATIGGDIRVVNTGSARWRLTSAPAGDTAIVAILGDVIVEGGAFETQGTGNALTVFEVHHYGDVVVTGGNFSVARGSQGSGSGSTRWYIHEGNFSMSNATTQNSNPTNAWFVFDKDTAQTISLSAVTYGGGGLAIEVASGAALDFGLSELGGNGLFTLNAGAALATAHPGGIDSTLQSTGNVTLNSDASFIFNGTAAQVTSALMPDTLSSLTIANPDTVTLSQETRINGVLRLVAGVFDNTIPFTLGPNGSISYEGGSLLIPVGIEDDPLPELPRVFALYQNYPNPFNPSTTIRYDVPQRSHVSIKVYDVLGRQVAELANDEHAAGAYTITWNARELASGVYYYRMATGDFVSVRKLVLMK